MHFRIAFFVSGDRHTGGMAEYIDLSRADAAAALDVLEQAQLTKRRAEVQEALAMLRVVHTYRHQIPTDKVRLGGEGTPTIDDFACLELAAALHRSVDAVTPMVTELLNLETRLPRLWEIVIGCGAPLWLARRVARLTGELNLAKARWVDATIAPFITRLVASRLLRFVEGLVVQADPEAANARWERARQPKVEIGGMQRDGLRDVYGWLTAADATFLDAALDQLAGILVDQGSTEPAPVRRATALGILATPARALAMIQHSVAQPALTDTGTPAERRPAEEESNGLRAPIHCPGHSCGTVTVEPGRLLPKSTLVIHLSDRTLLEGQGVGRCERLGPVTLQQIRALLDGSRVTVRPVFDPDGVVPVDSTRSPNPSAAPPCYGTRSRSGPTVHRGRLGSTWITPDRGSPVVPDRPGRTTSVPCAANPIAPRPTPVGGSPSPLREPSSGEVRSAGVTS